MPTSDRKLRVFLCHASQDKPVVRELYQKLLAEGWVDPWLDEEKLLPGQDWDLEIERAVEASDAVIVCLSNKSVTKEGYVQRELKFVLDIALEKPEGTIFIVPLRLDDCVLPRRLRALQYVDYFPHEQQKRAYQRLLQSLNIRRDQSVSKEGNSEKFQAVIPEPVKVEVKENKVPETKPSNPAPVVSTTATSSIFDIGGSVLLILYFLLSAIYMFGDNDNQLLILLGVAAILTGIFLLIRRQIAVNIVFKISTAVFLLATAAAVYLAALAGSDPTIARLVEGIAAVVAGGALAVTIRSPRKPALYSSIAFALFLFLTGVTLILNNQFYDYPTIVLTPIIIAAIITPILLWMEV